MDSQTTSPAAPDTLAGTLHNDIIDKAERNEFSNTAREIVLNFHQNSHSAVPTGAGLAECVSLEKISDPSNVLEESSHALQGTGSLPDDDHTPVPTTISLPLPHELMEHILLLVDTKSMLKCRLVNREFNAIIQSSTLVQYSLACKAAGVINNSQSPLSYAERLEALKKREDAWKKLTPVFETTIKVIEQSSTFYELSAGNYFILDKSGKDLYYCRLPSSPQDNPQWLRIPGHDPGSGFIVDTGMAVYEHDLVVNVISSEVGNQADMQRHSLDLVLLKFSTGEYHPLARRQLIHVQRSPSAEPYTSVKIVGDSLALVIHDHDGSKLFIFDWKTGHKRLQHEAPEDAYCYSIPIFISSELLLVPNLFLSHFEVWHLFPSHPNPNPPIQILSLQIPAVSNNYSISRIDCHGEPNPFLHSMPYFPPRPFFPSSENSIFIVNFLLESFPLRRTYKLIMHRRALLDMIQKWASPALLEQQLEQWLTNEVTMYKVADPDDGSVILAAQSELVSTFSWNPRFSPQTRDSLTGTSQISSTSPTSHISADSSSASISSESTSFTLRFNLPRVQWAYWGPPISRWFQTNGNYTWLINQSAGQRCVFLVPNPRDKGKCMIDVADFNLYNVRRNAETMAQLKGEQGEDNGGGGGNNDEGKKEENEEEMEKLDHQGEFSEEVYMGLKCVVNHAPVLMDEERLLGLKIDSEDRVESIKVLYFG
ncbi:hypothetical protein JOM56_007924 [Amanita muscaria]